MQELKKQLDKKKVELFKIIKQQDKKKDLFYKIEKEKQLIKEIIDIDKKIKE